MAAQVSARDLGGPSPKPTGNKPYRKLKAARKQPIISGPMSSETLALMSAAMRQLAGTESVPEPPVEDSINQKRKAKAKKAKEIASKQAWQVKKTGPVTEEAKATPPKPSKKAPKTKKTQRKKAKVEQQPQAPSPVPRLAELREKHSGGRPIRSDLYSPDALALVGSAVKFDVMRFISLLKAGETSEANLYVRVCCDNKPQVVSYVLSQHVDAIRHAALATEPTEYGKVIPRVKTEPAQHPAETMRVSHVRTRIKFIGKRRVVQRKRRMISADNLAWIELHTPIDSKCDLLITSRKGVALSSFERRCIMERRPLFSGNLQIGVELVTSQVEVPLPAVPARAKAGHLAYPMAAMRAMERSHRSRKKRATLGFPQVPDGPLFEEDFTVVTVDKVPDSANDDDGGAPWDDSPPPSAQAVCADFDSRTEILEVVAPEHQPPVVADTQVHEDHTTFFNEVVRLRLVNQKYLRKKHFARQLRKELQQKIEEDKALRIKFDRISESLKIKRIRSQFSASWSEPNYHAGISHPPKPELVDQVTRNNRMSCYHGKVDHARVRMRARCPVQPTGHRLLKSTFDWAGLQPETRATLLRIFNGEVLEQKEYVRHELWLEANDVTLSVYHDEYRYNRWCVEAERNAHSKDATSYGLQMHLLAMEQGKPSLGFLPGYDPKYERAGTELFSVEHWEHIEVRLGRVASLKEARRKRRYELEDKLDREAAVEEAAESLVSTKVNLSDALSGGHDPTKGMTDEERKAYFDALSGKRELNVPIRPSFSHLKTARLPDLDMAKSMFNHWVAKGKGGIILPPDKS